MNDDIIKYLEQIKDDYGQDVFKDFKRTKAILDDYTRCKMQKEVNILIEVLKQDAYFAFYDNPRKAKETFFKIKDILCNNMSLKEDSVEWAIYIWTYVAGIKLKSLKINQANKDKKSTENKRKKILMPKLSVNFKEVLILILFSVFVLSIIWTISYYTMILSNNYGLIFTILISIVFICFHAYYLLFKNKRTKFFHLYLFSYLMVFVCFFIFIAYFRIF